MAKPKTINARFKGKTIKRVDSTRVANEWTFYFTDGTKITVGTEAIGYGLYGLCIEDENSTA